MLTGSSMIETEAWDECARHFLFAAQNLLRAMKPRSGLEDGQVKWGLYRL